MSDWRRTWKLWVAVLVPLAIWLMPGAWIPVEGLTIVQHRIVAVFFMAMLFWVLEPIPVFATSVLVIVLELLVASDKGIIWLRQGQGETSLGTLLSYKAVMATLASPIIMLFLGGFFLAMAAKKYRLDQNLARVLLKPFGTNPRLVLLGLMLITAVFSMFMSNTATTAMMLAILMPVLDAFEDDDPGRIAFVLGVPFAANIGGIGTPIGTPPNAVAMKYLTGDLTVSFGTWMFFAVPYVIVMLLVAWFLLLAAFRPRLERMALEIKGRFLKTPSAITVYVTFAATVLLWLLGDLTGMNSYVVAMIPVLVFCVSGIITAEDLKKLSWDVLWLVAGGIALGVGLEETGLSKAFVASIPFERFPPLLIVAATVMVAILMATFMSHTATANLILPITAALGANLTTLTTLGGAKMIILAVTLSCSLAMALPISTPPNAMAYATGQFKSRDMLKTGIIIDVIGLTGLLGLLLILNLAGFF